MVSVYLCRHSKCHFLVLENGHFCLIPQNIRVFIFEYFPNDDDDDDGDDDDDDHDDYDDDDDLLYDRS